MDTPWIYYRICVGEFNGAIDKLAAETFPKLMTDIGASQWFYLRYFDETDGLHVRLRFKVDASREAEARRAVYEDVTRVLRGIPMQPPSDYAPLVMWTDIVFPPHVLGIHEGEYEPELDKYGGALGLEDAERMFCLSTRVAVDTLRLDEAGVVSRKTMAPVLMAAVFECIPIEADPAAYLGEYSMSWLPPDLTQSRMLREEFFDKASELISDGVAIVQPDDHLPGEAVTVVDAWRDGLRQAAAFYKNHRELGDDFGSRQAWQWLHLTNNRLGFSPFEEAYLATLLEGHYRGAAAHAA